MSDFKWRTNTFLAIAAYHLRCRHVASSHFHQSSNYFKYCYLASENINSSCYLTHALSLLSTVRAPVARSLVVVFSAACGCVNHVPVVLAPQRRRPAAGWDSGPSERKILVVRRFSSLAWLAGGGAARIARVAPPPSALKQRTTTAHSPDRPRISSY